MLKEKNDDTIIDQTVKLKQNHQFVNEVTQNESALKSNQIAPVNDPHVSFRQKSKGLTERTSLSMNECYLKLQADNTYKCKACGQTTPATHLGDPDLAILSQQIADRKWKCLP